MGSETIVDLSICSLTTYYLKMLLRHDTIIPHYACMYRYE